MFFIGMAIGVAMGWVFFERPEWVKAGIQWVKAQF